MLQEEGSRFIEVKEKGKLKKLSTNRAIMRATFIAATNGNSRAQKLVFDLMTKDENRRAADNAARFNAAHDFKQWWAGELKRRKLRGEPEPDFLFHPDKFHLDYASGTVTYTGRTADQQRYIELYEQLRQCHEFDLLELLEEGPPPPEDLPMVWEDLKHDVKIISKLHGDLGLPWAKEFPLLPDFNELSEVEERVRKELGLPPRPKKRS